MRGLRVRHFLPSLNSQSALVAIILVFCNSAYIQQVQCHGRGRHWSGSHSKELREEPPADDAGETLADDAGQPPADDAGQPPLPRKYISYIRPFQQQWPSTFDSTTPASNLDVCPCVLKPGTRECVMYDPRFMASTVEEAILYFPDLQIHDVAGGTTSESGSGATTGPISPESGSGLGTTVPVEVMPPPPEALGSFSSPPPYPPPPSENTIDSDPHQLLNRTHNETVSKSRVGPAAGASGAANPAFGPPPPPSTLCDRDTECFECSAVLLNRLGTSGLLEGDDLDRVSQKFGVEASNRQAMPKHNCRRYRFAETESIERSLVGPANTSGVPGDDGPAAPNGTSSGDPELDDLVHKLREKGEQRWREKQQSQNHSREHTMVIEHTLRYRNKRQSPSKSSLKNLGQQFKIDCTKRGNPVEQGSNWVGLCNVCWAWRKLPSTYFPQYVNELVCDSDTKCMSGFASCQQRYKSVDILQNTGTQASPIWKQVTIAVANYCDCEVESGSSLHNFVAA